MILGGPSFAFFARGDTISKGDEDQSQYCRPHRVPRLQRTQGWRTSVLISLIERLGYPRSQEFFLPLSLQLNQRLMSE
jgi:hypothetical protein